MLYLKLSPTLREFLTSSLQDHLKQIHYDREERESVIADDRNIDKNGNIKYDGKKFSQKEFSKTISDLYHQAGEVEELLGAIKK